MRQHHRLAGVAVDTAIVRRTAMHRHPGVLEIVYVLAGELEVQVSSERYLLEVGDYAVLNAGDTHAFDGGDGATVASVQIDIAAYADAFPELSTKIFACESFDLPRYLGTEAALRDALLVLCSAPAGERPDLVDALLHELLDGYGVEQYYDRRRVLSRNRRAVLRRILVLLGEHACERDVLDRVSREMQYSKGAVSRLTRDSMGMSFSDILTNLRLTRAEVLLLETDRTMLSIAAECGFSDVKYFTRSFRSWFGCTPAEYRRANQGRIRAGDDVDELDGRTAELVERHRAVPLPTGRPPRRSVTPVAVLTAAAAPEPAPAPGDSLPRPMTPAAPHLLPIRVHGHAAGEEADAGWRDVLIGADRSIYRPVLILPVEAGSEVESLLAELQSHGVEEIEVWVAYRFGEELEAERVAGALGLRSGVSALPMLGA